MSVPCDLVTIILWKSRPAFPVAFQFKNTYAFTTESNDYFLLKTIHHVVVRKNWVRILALQLSFCVLLGKSPKLSEFQILLQDVKSEKHRILIHYVHGTRDNKVNILKLLRQKRKYCLSSSAVDKWPRIVTNTL